MTSSFAGGTSALNLENNVRKNMSYAELYEILIDGVASESKTSLPFYSIPPDGLVAYKFKDKNTRASIRSLKLTSDHKTLSPTIHVFGLDTLFSRGYKSQLYSSSTFYCAWLESSPHILIFWERDIYNGISPAIKNGRFESGLTSAINSLSNCSSGYSNGLNKREFNEGTIMDCLLIDAAGHEIPTRDSETDSEIKESVDESISSAPPCIDLIEIDEEKLQSKLKCLQEYLVMSSTYCRIPPFLMDDDDDERDPNWSMSALRDIFLNVCYFGDAVMNLRQYPWQNMKKTVLNELKSEWERAIRTVREKKLDGMIPQSVWLEAMWLHVLGFPSRVRTKEDVLPFICFSFSSLRAFDKESVLVHLEVNGCRQSLALWIYTRFYLDSFEEDVLEMSHPVSWNSFLCSSNGRVHFTRLQADGDGDNTIYSRVEPTNPLFLYVDGGDYCREDVLPIELQLEQEKWFPKDFARNAFEEIRTRGRSDHYILGHCTPEQCIVGMCKKGISPLATYDNLNSCGRGMYFFRLDFDVLQHSFDELNVMGKTDESNPLGIQFRAFVYALFTVFQKADYDATSPSILLFLVPCNEHDLNPYDAISSHLPTCNDNNSSAGWKCFRCKRVFTEAVSRDSITVATNSKSRTSAAGVKDAISMIDLHDVEKFNAMAILGGVVDFQRIPTGVYSAIITDNNSKNITTLLRNMMKWNNASEFLKWKRLVCSENISTYRRPVMYFKDSGRFADTRDLVIADGNGRREDWRVPGPNDPIQETVFISTEALNTLLRNATSIFCVFVSPDNSFTEREVYNKQKQEYPPTEDTIGKEFLNDSLSLSEGKHLYWENRLRCKLSGCIPLGTEAL